MSPSLTLTPANEVVDAEGRGLVEDVGGDLGMEIDALYEHPEDWWLETEHEGGQHWVTQPGLSLVPDVLPGTFLLDVGSKVDWEEWSVNVQLN